MFWNTERQKILENQFIAHTEKEEQLFSKLFESLTGIRDEIHKINECQAEANASHTLAIIKARQEVLETCFDRLLEKKRYEREMDELHRIVESKVDLAHVKAIWAVVSLFAITCAWVIEKIISIKGVM